MSDDEEPIEDAKGDRRHGEKIHRGNRLAMVAQKRLPSLCRLRVPRLFPHPALHTGMPRWKQFSLEWAQTDLKVKRIHLLKTKNGSHRVMPLNSEAIAALERQWAVAGQAQRVFVADDGLPFIHKPMRRWFEEAVLKARIRDFSWHCLRHTFCSQLVMAGVALKTVQELMGDKTIQTTARYARLSRLICRTLWNC